MNEADPNEIFRKAIDAKNSLQDYAGAWRAVGCTCNNCPTCDDRYLTPEKAEEIAEFIHFLALHAGALEHQMKFMIESVQECWEWKGIHSAPKDGQPVLLDHPEWHTHVLRGAWDAHEIAWRVHGFGCPATQPNKWQPLPARPEVE